MYEGFTNGRKGKYLVQFGLRALPSPLRHEREQHGANVLRKPLPSAGIGTRNRFSDGLVGAEFVQPVQDPSEAGDGGIRYLRTIDARAVDWPA